MSRAEFAPAAKLLHWLIAGLIVLQFVLARLAENAEDVSPVRELALLANHRSVGITILILAIVRLGWRKFEAPPAPLAMPQWQLHASMISHWLLYGLLFLLPISGWLMASAAADSVSWFNIIQLPDLVGPDPALEEVLEEVHETFAKILFLLASIHILAALKHSLYDRDGAIGRISSAISIALFAGVIALGIFNLTSTGSSSSQSVETAATPQEVVGSDLPTWNIDTAASYIRFTGEQAGGTFDGEWMLWSAEIRFDGDRLAAGSIDVNVLVNGVETNDDDRDQTLLDVSWFDASAFPEVLYRATHFAPSDDGYVALGNVVFKGTAFPVPLTFTVAESGSHRVLDGTADIDRLALQLGTGEWTDTTSVGQFVTVSVHVEATVSQ